MTDDRLTLSRRKLLAAASAVGLVPAVGDALKVTDEISTFTARYADKTGYSEGTIGLLAEPGVVGPSVSPRLNEIIVRAAGFGRNQVQRLGAPPSSSRLYGRSPSRCESKRFGRRSSNPDPDPEPPTRSSSSRESGGNSCAAVTSRGS